jgi:putative ABC transport system permease protein
MTEHPLNGLDEDIREHIERETADNVERGMSPEEARYAALRRFGNVTQAKEDTRAVWIPVWVEQTVQDLRYALRTLRQNPGFAAVAILTLAVGIGSTLTMFALVDAILLRNLPTDDHGRIVSIGLRDQGAQGIAYLDFLDLRQATHSFIGVGAFQETTMNVSDDERAPERVSGSYTSADTFRLVGANPVLGREFRPDDDRSGTPPVVILGHRLWLHRYHGDPAVVGRTIRVNGIPSVIVGVMGPGFQFPAAAEIWQPFGAMVGLDAQTRRNRTFGAFGRLRDGSTLTQAAAELDGIAERLSREYPETHRDTRATVTPFTSRLIGPSLSLIWIAMMGASSFVLLIACANVANLLLVRSIRRSREIHLRVSLGATRWRIVRQLLAESTALAGLATAMGFGLSQLGTWWFESYVSQFSGKPYWIQVVTDARLIMAVASVGIFTTFVFGLVPALHAFGAGIHHGEPAGMRASTGPRARYWTNTLMVVELTLTLVLLAACGLELQSLRAASRLDHVMDTSGLMTLRLQLPALKYPTPDQRSTFYEELQRQFEAVPAISAVSVASQLPVSGASYGDVTFEHRTGETVRIPAVLTGPRYFETLRLPILRGRALTDLDARPGGESAVINQLFAATYFPNDDPIGRRVRLTLRGTPTPWLTVVGISTTIRQSNVGNPTPVVYVPYQLQPPAAVALLVRSSAEPGPIATLLRDEVRNLDADLPLFEIRTMEDALTQVLFPGRILGTVLMVLAVVAVVLATVGLYAVTAYSVEQRTQELGIRMALGARRRQVVWLILRRAIGQMAVALPIGLAGSLAVGRLLESILVGTSGTDPTALSITAIVMVIVSVAACCMPVRRATRLDPVVALRQD